MAHILIIVSAKWWYLYLTLEMHVSVLILSPGYICSSLEPIMYIYFWITIMSYSLTNWGLSAKHTYVAVKGYTFEGLIVLQPLLCN